MGLKIVAFFTLLLCIFATLETVVASSSLGSNCQYNMTTFNGQFLRTIKVHHPSNIKFTWVTIRGTRNLTISRTNDLILAHNFENDTIIFKVKFAHASGCRRRGGSLGVATFMVLASFCFLLKARSALICTVLLLALQSIFFLSGACSSPHIHIKVPFDYAEKICLNNSDKCLPIKCHLSFLPSTSYSTFPATNEVLFKDKFCTLKRPQHWDEWTQLHFGTNKTTDELLIADFDSDGLVNIVEYYGDQTLANMSSGSSRRRRSAVFNVASIGTNPNNADSDGDLLLDGFEYYNNMSPVKRDDKNADNDNDGLSNLNEQIHKTDPLNPDSDGDGVVDGTEVRNGADPTDPSDSGQEDKSLQTAVVRLTIGDYSGSHSERYTITVGSITHQSPGFGIVGFGDYTFKPGKYMVRIQHVASKYHTPDYDYRAAISKVSGKASLMVEDPDGILGYHDESYSDYTKGKSATMIIGVQCSGLGSTTDCNCLKTCEKCKGDSSCIWVRSFCRKKRILDFSSTSCPCTKCEKWYRKEKKDMAWLKDLNINFKCPCKTRKEKLFNLPTWRLKAVDNPSRKEWDWDAACMANGLPFCMIYHPGAYGCLRSLRASMYGSRQQCCYDSSGNVLPAGHPGAGTPDRSITNHVAQDVEPFEFCCKDCNSPKHCKYYIDGVRKGDTSHCK